MSRMWPNGRLNTRAHDFELEHELRDQRALKMQWQRQGRAASCIAELDQNIADILREQERRRKLYNPDNSGRPYD